MDGYVGVILDRRTGLHHGALYVNKPTPSGADRYLLSLSVKEGRRSARAAGEDGNASFPDARPLDTSGLSDVDLAGLVIPEGSVLTLVTPMSAEAMADGGPAVEMRVGGAPRPTDIDPAVLSLLVDIGRLRPDSGSGRDPALHYAYEHFVAA